MRPGAEICGGQEIVWNKSREQKYDDYNIAANCYESVGGNMFQKRTSGSQEALRSKKSSRVPQGVADAGLGIGIFG